MMPRHPYTPSTDDFLAAKAYVQRKLATQPDWLDNRQAEEQWTDAKRDPLTLGQWCERWLNEPQWRQLKAALRAARKRHRDRSGTRDPAVNVTLSRPAWLILSALARQDGLTFSDWLIYRHRDEWLEL